MNALVVRKVHDRAAAADYHQGIYEAPARSYCPPPGTPKVYYQRTWDEDARPLLYVARSEPPFQIYVAPQTAFIISDACPNQYRQNWYEGKLWYYDAGSPQGPDTFRIIRRN